MQSIIMNVSSVFQMMSLFSLTQKATDRICFCNNILVWKSIDIGAIDNWFSSLSEQENVWHKKWLQFRQLVLITCKVAFILLFIDVERTHTYIDTQPTERQTDTIFYFDKKVMLSLVLWWEKQIKRFLSFQDTQTRGILFQRKSHSTFLTLIFSS